MSSCRAGQYSIRINDRWRICFLWREGGPSDVEVSSITTNPQWLPNPTPGEILLQEFLRPPDMSQTALARALNAPPCRINEIVFGKRAVTVDTDLPSDAISSRCFPRGFSMASAFSSVIGSLPKTMQGDLKSLGRKAVRVRPPPSAPAGALQIRYRTQPDA